MNKQKNTNSFLKQLFIGALLFLLYTTILKYTNISLKFIKEPINMTAFCNNVITLFDKDFKTKTLNTTNLIYDKKDFIKGENIFYNSSTNSVESLNSGIVIKIEKINNLYSVTIQSNDGKNFKYSDLEGIDCSIYQYIYSNDVIGRACLINNQYVYKLIISDKEEVYKY